MKRTIIARNCSSILSQLQGNMFAKEPENLAFTFRTPRRIGLHGLFCTGDFQLLFLDNQMKVIEIGLLKKWRQSRSKTKATHCLELAHYITVQLGDTISLKNPP